MKPMLILAAIAGGMTGIFTLVVIGAGLRAPAAPGQIIAVFAADRRRQLRRRDPLGARCAATVSFLIALGDPARPARPPTRTTSAQATAEMEAMKGKKSSVVLAP